MISKTNVITLNSNGTFRFLILALDSACVSGNIGLSNRCRIIMELLSNSVCRGHMVHYGPAQSI